MRCDWTRWSRAALAASIVAILLSGCRGYEVDVTIAPDGSGTRTTVLNTDVASPDDADLKNMVELFGLTQAQGWQRIVPATTDTAGTGAGAALASLDEAKKIRFERHIAVKDAQHWDSCSGDIHIRGAGAGAPRSAAAGAPAGQDVEFDNVVAVENGAQAGRPTLTYRERFSWSGLLEWFAASSAQTFSDQLKKVYPFLSDSDLAEIRGYVAGQLTAAVVGRGPKDDIDAALDPLAEPLKQYAQRVVQRRRPGIDVSEVGKRCEALLNGEDDELEKSLAEELPGADLAVVASIDLKVTFPGPVLESNADETDGTAAIWHIDVWDALGRPIEVFARGELEAR